MARNRFDVDEKFESYNIGHLRRSMVYIRRHAKIMIISLLADHSKDRGICSG